MNTFFELEGAYLAIGLFLLGCAAFVTTRPFMPKGAFKKGMISVGMLIVTLVSAHFYVTTSRMDGVKEIFNEGGTVICENRMMRKVSRSVLISQELNWRVEGDLLTSDDYERDFHTSRCIEYVPGDYKPEQ